jgi:hypothetical protein
MQAAGANTGGGTQKDLFFGMSNASGPAVIPHQCTLERVGFSLNQPLSSGSVNLDISTDDGSTWTTIATLSSGGATQFILNDDSNTAANLPITFNDVDSADPGASGNPSPDHIRLRTVANSASPTSAEPTAILYFEKL